MTYTTILIAVIIFLVVVLVLVAVLLFAKSKLLPSGIVKISINNGKKELMVNPGSSLLSTLGDNGVFLPRA